MCAILGLLVALLPQQAVVLSPEVLRRLVVVQDFVLPGLVVKQVGEAKAGLVVGACEATSQRPAVLVFDGPGAPISALAQPAAPYFAIHPSGAQVAYWRAVPVAESGPMAELVAVTLATGTQQPLSPPQRLGDGGSLCWPLPSNVIFVAPRLLPDGTQGMVWRFDLATACAYCLLSVPPGARAGVVTASPDPGVVMYVEATGAWRLPLTGLPAQPAQAGEALWRAPGGQAYLSLEPKVELRANGMVKAALPLPATAAAWAPSGAAVLLAARGGLYVAPADFSFVRQLTGLTAEAADFVHPFWRACLCEAATGSLRPRPQLHLFSLGTEQLTATIFFPCTAAPQLGAKVWVARDFERDAGGAVVKPKWPTLKACLSVTRSHVSDGGLMVEAVNSGVQGGEVQRLAVPGASAGNLSQIATTIAGRRVLWVERYDLRPRSDLRAWISGLPALGELRTLHIEHRHLDAP
jgi:hypothetical protein